MQFETFSKKISLRYFEKSVTLVACFYSNQLKIGLERLRGLLEGWILASDPQDSKGRCVVFLGKTLYSHSTSLHPGL